MERLAADGPEAAAALRRFAQAWDEGRVDPTRCSRAWTAIRRPRSWIPSASARTWAAFLPVAALRPAPRDLLRGRARAAGRGVGARGVPVVRRGARYGDLLEDGRRRLSCHVCGGAWIAARLRCPFCESWNSRDLARLMAEELEAAYFIEACRACHGYLKGVDRRQRWNAGRPLVEDWGSPAPRPLCPSREGYWRSTPSLAHLLPGRGAPGEDRA